MAAAGAAAAGAAAAEEEEGEDERPAATTTTTEAREEEGKGAGGGGGDTSLSEGRDSPASRSREIRCGGCWEADDDGKPTLGGRPSAILEFKERKRKVGRRFFLFFFSVGDTSTRK